MKPENQQHDSTLRSIVIVPKRMSLFNDSECADVNGECRYIDEMNVNHFFTITSCFIVIYLFFMIFLYCKLGTRLSHYNKLPRKNIDIGRYHLSTQMAKKAQESRQRMESMLTQPAEYADKSCAMLFDTDTKVRNLLNYQATVASSYQAIDDDISRMYPNLKRNNKQDLRTYVLSLKSQFPKLTDSICDNYIKTYELAKFSDQEWTKDMFDEWQVFFKDFTDALTPPDAYSLPDNSLPIRSRLPILEAVDDYESDSDTSLLWARTLEDNESD